MNKTVIYSLFAISFLAFWGFGMVTAFSSGACRKGLSTAERTDRACLRSMGGLEALKKIGQPDKPSDAALYVGYAVAAFGKGQKEQAQDLFTHAYRAGRDSRSTVALNNAVEVPEALFAAIVRVHHKHVPSGARSLWWETVEEDDPGFVKMLIEAMRESGDQKHSVSPEGNS